MTLEAQLESLREALAEFAREYGATVTIAPDRGEFLRRLSEDSLGLPVVLMFTGEVMDPANQDAGVVWRTYSAVVARGHEWTVEKGDNLTATAPGRPPLLEILQALRNALMVATFGGPTEFNPRYTETALVDAGDLPVDVWQVGIECGAQIATA